MKIYTNITTDYIQPLPSNDTHLKDGAELQFYGRVRDSEHGEKIKALDYEYYENMAELELQKLAEITYSKFDLNEFYCIHRVGEVPVGESSLLVQVWSKHRVNGLDAMAWFISQLKKYVPIWKNAVLKDGTIIPSHCDHC